MAIENSMLALYFDMREDIIANKKIIDYRLIKAIPRGQIGVFVKELETSWD